MKAWLNLGFLFCLALAVSGCASMNYKPYLPEKLRGDGTEPSPDIPGVFTGKKKEWVVY